MVAWGQWFFTGTISPPRGVVDRSRDIFVCQNWRRDVTEHPTLHKIVPHNREVFGSKCNTARFSNNIILVKICFQPAPPSIFLRQPRLSVCVYVFSGNSGFFPHPRDVLMRWAGVFRAPAWVSVAGGVSGSVMGRCPIHSGFLSCTWAARSGSGHPWPWTEIRGWKIRILLVFVDLP